MKTKVSTGIRSGDPLDATIEADRIVLTPRRPHPNKAKIVTDRITGLPVLTAGTGALMTTQEVADILANYP